MLKHFSKNRQSIGVALIMATLISIVPMSGNVYATNLDTDNPLILDGEVRVVGNPKDWTNQDIMLTLEGAKIISVKDQNDVNINVEGNSWITVGNNVYTVQYETGSLVLIVDKIDKVKPTSPEIAIIDNEIEVIKGSDTLSGIKEHIYVLNETETNSLSDYKSLTDGEHILEVKAIDNATNKSIPTNATFLKEGEIITEINRTPQEEYVKEIQESQSKLEDLINVLGDNPSVAEINEIESLIVTIQNEINRLPKITQKDELQINLDNLTHKFELIKGIQIVGGNRSVSVGNSLQLKHTSALDSHWETSNGNIVSIDENGKITALKEGYAFITARINGTNKTGTITVTVKNQIVNVNLFNILEENVEIKTNEEFDLDYEVLPVDADNKSVIWNSNNNDVAKVVDGKVIGIKEGTALIKGKTEDGGFTDTVLVRVLPNPQDVKIVAVPRSTEWAKSAIIDVHVQGDLGEVILPSGAKVFTRNLSFPVIKNGEYTFTVVSENGKVIENVTVNIDHIDRNKPVISFRMDEKDITQVTAYVEDNESGVKRLITPEGKVVKAPYKFDANKLQGTFSAVDKIGNVGENNIEFTTVAIGGTTSNTTFVTAGVPTKWTNKNPLIMVGAQNLIDGVGDVDIRVFGEIDDKGTFGKKDVDLTPIIDEFETKVKIVEIEEGDVVQAVVFNESGAYAKELVLDKVDKVGPTIEVRVTEDSIQYNAIDNASGIKNIYLPDGTVEQFNDEEMLEFSGEVMLKDIAALLGKVQGTVQIIVEDFAGNLTTVNIKVDIDQDGNVPVDPVDPPVIPDEDEDEDEDDEYPPIDWGGGNNNQNPPTDWDEIPNNPNGNNGNGMGGGNTLITPPNFVPNRPGANNQNRVPDVKTNDDGMLPIVMLGATSMLALGAVSIKKKKTDK